jgi:hypothetical protein
MNEPLSAPNVRGNTPAERMDSAIRMMFNVPKGLVLKRDAFWKRAQNRQRAAKKPA